MIKKIDKAVYRVTSVVSVASYVGFLAVMAIIVVDVCLRKIMDSGVTGAYELVERILMFAVFASFAYTQSLQGHVHVTMFVSKLPTQIRFIALGVTGLLSSAAAFLLSYAAVIQANDAFRKATMTGVLHIPLFPFYWIEVVCMAAFGLALLWDVFKDFAAIKNREIAEEIQANWI